MKLQELIPEVPPETKDIKEPQCYRRKCAYFSGVRRLGEQEETEVVYCVAFPDGIPNEIAYGNNLHTKPLKDQPNNIVFEKEE